MTDETRAKLSAVAMGRIMSPETRAKISVARMGRPGTGPKHHTAETLAKMSAAMTGRIFSPEWRAKISAAHWRGGKQVNNAKMHAKRRVFGFNPLNSWFPGCEGHHINVKDVIYLPRKLHRSIWHNQQTGKGMAAMNALAGQYLTEDWT